MTYRTSHRLSFRKPNAERINIDAARKTGAREDELIRTKAEHIDHNTGN
jgi:hypothetical protein